MTTPLTCLITGANAGIGRAAAIQLAELGHRVLLGCRNPARGQEAALDIRELTGNPAVTYLPLDLSLQSSIRAAAAQIDHLDVLIHNAAFFDQAATRRAETREGVEQTWATNHLGPVLLTDLLLPKIKESESGRILAVSSKGLLTFPFLAVDLSDPEFSRRRFTVTRAYYQSKLAQVAWMLDLADALKDTRITVHGVRVTNVKIDLSRYPGMPRWMHWMYAIKSRFSISPDEMARTYTWLATSEEAGRRTGGYWDAPGKAVPVSRWARDPAHRHALVAFTRRQLALA